MYKRVLLKISGEALSSAERPVCFEKIEQTAADVKKAALLGHTERVNEENYTYDVSSMAEKMKIVEAAGKIS